MTPECSTSAAAAGPRLQLFLCIATFTMHAGHEPRAAAAENPMPQTPDEWVGKLVEEMSAARDVEEAKARGHRFLNAFGSFVSQQVSMVISVGRLGDRLTLLQASSQDRGSSSGLERVQELQKENMILKRCAAIRMFFAFSLQNLICMQGGTNSERQAAGAGWAGCRGATAPPLAQAVSGAGPELGDDQLLLGSAPAAGDCRRGRRAQTPRCVLMPACDCVPDFFLLPCLYYDTEQFLFCLRKYTISFSWVVTQCVNSPVR